MHVSQAIVFSIIIIKEKFTTSYRPVCSVQGTQGQVDLLVDLCENPKVCTGSLRINHLPSLTLTTSS